MSEKNTPPLHDFSSAFSRLIFTVVTVLSVFFALSLTAVFFKEERFRAFAESAPWFPYLKAGIMLATAFLTGYVCVKLFFKKAPALEKEHGHYIPYRENRGGGAKLVLYGLLILAAVDLGFWGLRWFNSKVIPTQQPPALQAAVQAPPPAPAPPAQEFIFADQYGIALGKTFQVFSTKAGETNGPFVVAKPGKISWGTFTPENLLVFRDGVLMNTEQHFTNAGPNLIGKFTFTAKSNAVEYWVATGLSHRVSN